MTNRLSEKQLVFLSRVASSETPTEGWPQGLPLCVNHRFMEYDFLTEAERDRWLANLVTRGFVTCHHRHFYRLTDAGRAAVARQYYLATEA